MGEHNTDEDRVVLVKAGSWRPTIMLVIVQPIGYNLLATGVHLRMLNAGCPASLDMVDIIAGVLLLTYRLTILDSQIKLK